jgi:tetratricopeptide (TPR) repeat protein
MVSKSTFTSRLTRDPRQRAEQYAREGKPQKAAEMYARAGDYRKAAQLAIEAGDERLAVDAMLRAVFGEDPKPLSALDAADLLVAGGHHDAAIGLFELARSYRRAAASALALGQAARAARIYERGRSYADAALQFENAELLEDALRMLELETKRLGGRDAASRLDAPTQERLARLELRRAEVLRKLGKGTEAAALLRDVRPSLATVRLLEQKGKYREAIEAALSIGETETAVRLLNRAPGIDRQLAAQIYLRGGHPLEAANLYASLGMAREAAEAYEAGGDPAKAGSRWETANEHERAADAYQRAKRPRDAGRCYAVLGKMQLAAAAFARAGDHVAAAEQYLKGRLRVAAATELVAAGDKAQAARVLMQVADGGPEHETATLQLAPLLLDLGQAEEALRRLRQLPATRPGALAAAAAASAAAGSGNDRMLPARERLYWMGRAYEQVGKLESAETCYREMADPGNEHRDALSRLVAVRARLRPEPTGADYGVAPLAAPAAAGRPPSGAGAAIRTTPSLPHLRLTPGGTPIPPPLQHMAPIPGPPQGAGGFGGTGGAGAAGAAGAAGGGRRPTDEMTTRATGALPSAAAAARTAMMGAVPAPGGPLPAGAAGAAGAGASGGGAAAARPGAPTGSRPAASSSTAAQPTRHTGEARSTPAVTSGGSGGGGTGGTRTRTARTSGRAGRDVGSLAIGQVLAGRFQILSELGQGGMGRVYKAQDLRLGEAVAIKMLLGQPDDGSVDAERLLREVQICRKITHPNVVRVFDLGRHEGWIFIIMELLEGRVLSDLIDAPERTPLAQVRTILTEIASGLQEAHALGVVHRDLKPENVILTATRLKILDFGIARMSGLDKRLTQVGFALGSPLYMSPEQIQGTDLDCRSDLYSLGVLAFALLAGREPFDGANSTAIAIQHLQQPPPSLRTLRPDLPAGWAELVAKLLSKHPDDRCQSSRDVIEALALLPAG